MHPATSNEEGALLARLAEALGTGNLDHRIGQQDLSDGAVAEAFAMPVADIEQADAIVIVGSQLRFELPLLHQRVRKASLRGAKVHVVNPVDFDFTFDVASKQIVPPSQLAGALATVDLEGASRAVVIVGGLAESRRTCQRDPHGCARLRQGEQRGAVPCSAGCQCTRPGALRRVAVSSRDAQAMLADARSAYVIYGIEPGLDFADQAAAMNALGSAQVVAFSHFACESTRRVADVILPIGALPEIDATLTNLEGRDQVAVPAGKLPGETRAGWRVLRALGAELAMPGFAFTDLAGLREGCHAERCRGSRFRREKHRCGWS